MSSTIPIGKRVGWLNPDNTVNFKALGAHIASVEAKVFHDSDTPRNAHESPAVPPAGRVERVVRAIGSKIFPDIIKRLVETNVYLPDDVERADGGKNEVHIGTVDVGSDDNRYYWFGTIEVGTPPEPFTVELDTGSSDLFLPSSDSDSSCDGHKRWDLSASSTSNRLGGERVPLTYGGGGKALCDKVTDTVSIAGYTATTQTLGAASEYSPHFGHKIFPPDGLLGLAFEQKSKFKAPPLIQTLYIQDRIAEPVFHSSLRLLERSWKVNLEKIEVDGKTVPSNALSNIECIIDTGTALILGMNEQVALLYNAIGGHLNRDDGGYHYYSFPGDSFPTISFTFGGTTFPIPPAVLNIGQVDANSSECVSGLVGNDTVNIVKHEWIVGAVFLQSVYATFDLGVKDVRKPRIGFATLAEA